MTDRKPYDPATEVGLECPKCRTCKNVPRPADVPAKVRMIEIICPECDDGDRHSETWWSAPGVEVSQDARAGYPETRVCTVAEFLAR
jgi:hypothetical protein